jgi:GDPmannose 4,6-dehydratase
MGRSLIFGVRGQDGSYLADYLLDKGEEVIGAKRRSSSSSDWRLSTAKLNPHFVETDCDITDFSSVINILRKYEPDRIYNLAAMSQVGTSFDQPFYTFNSITLGTTNILESIRLLKLQCKYYSASTSEMFGKNYSEDENGKYQDENTPFKPASPYGVAKLAAHEMIRLYREAYGIWACSGILFNHESPRRAEYFVSRKITKWIGQTLAGKTNEPIRLGNLRAYRDWGHAKDYVKAMVLMLDRNDPKDYVIGTGRTYSIYDFWCLACLFGGIDREKIIVDKDLFRPSEVDYLCARPTLAKLELGWEPSIDFKRLVKEMVNADIKNEAS